MKLSVGLRAGGGYYSLRTVNWNTGIRAIRLSAMTRCRSFTQRRSRSIFVYREILCRLVSTNHHQLRSEQESECYGRTAGEVVPHQVRHYFGNGSRAPGKSGCDFKTECTCKICSECTGRSGTSIWMCCLQTHCGWAAATGQVTALWRW